MQGSVDGIEISSAASVAAVAAIAAATSSLETRRGSVSWPINRLSYDIVKEEELLQVEKFFVCRNDAPLLIKWLIQHKEKRNSFNKRLLVLSSFRILTLKYTPFQNRLRVTKDYKLIDLEQMEVFHSSVGSHTSIKCSFVNGRVLHVDPGIHCENFVRGIQRAIHTIRLAYHPTRLPSIQIPKELNWQEFFEESQDPFELLAIAYRACCDDLKISFRPSVLERLNECALNTPSVVDFQYCLQQGSNTPQQLLKETQALARALQNTTLFEGVIVRDCNVGDAGISAIMQSLELNNSLEGLVFSRVRLSKICLVALENAIKNHGAIPLLTMGNTGGCAGGLSGQGKKRLKHGQKASKIQLRRLDFSFNAFDNDMAVSLSNTFQTLTDGLQMLRLESCRLNSRGITILLTSMKTAAWTSTLKELNFSGNRLDREGTFVLSDWITCAFALERLYLANTHLETGIFFKALKQNSILHESSLGLLDISYNSFTSTASEDFGKILAKTQSLSVLVLRGMKLSKKHLDDIFEPLFQNSIRTFPCSVDLSENDLSGKKARILATLLENSPCATRECLSLDNCNLKDESAMALLNALASCRSLDSLSLDGNGLVRKLPYGIFDNAQMEEKAGEALARLLGRGGNSTSSSTGAARGASHSSRLSNLAAKYLPSTTAHTIPPIKELFLSSTAVSCRSFGDDGANNHHDKEICYSIRILQPAIEALAFNQYLTVLDVSGNKCGDDLAIAIGTILPRNKTLRALFIDGNNTNVEGFVQLNQGLSLNNTLVFVPMPIHDTRKILEQRDPPRERLFGVLGKIYKNIERNQALMDREAAAKAHTIQEDTDNNSTGNKEQQAPRRRSINTEKEKKSSPPPAPVTVSTPAVAIPVTTSQPQKNAEPVPETVSEKSPSTAISIAKGDELTAFEKEMKNLTIRLQQKGKLNPNMTWTNKDKSIGKNNSINMMLKHTIQGSLDPLSQWTASISGSFSGVTSISTKDCEHLFEKLQAKKYASPDNYNEPTKQH